jgi:hypothetical protein
MVCKKLKQMVVTIHEQKHLRNDWYFDFEGQPFRDFLAGMTAEMKRLGVLVTVVRNRETIISINSYADLLNVVKISSPQDGHSNQCVGHIIGVSQRLDIMEDIGTAVRRVAFAPETVAPSSEFRKVCHNCGCGC